jgi:hypothetical protein
LRKPESVKRLCAGFFLAAFLLVSCATAPKAPFSMQEEGAELSLLPPGGSVYIWADTVSGRPLLDALSFEGRSGKDAAAILDSAKSAAAVVFPSDGEPDRRSFYLAASGDFPRVKANFSFVFSRDWKKQKSSAGSYWHSSSENLALAMGSKLLLASDKDPFLAPSEEAPIPPGFMDFRRGLALAGWLTDPPGPLNKFISSLGLPIQIPAKDFFFGAARTPGNDPAETRRWELVFRIRTASEREARSLLTLFSLARLFIQRGAVQEADPGEALSISPQEAAALLFANEAEQDRDFIGLHTSLLDENRIALLFKMFSVYSK